MQRGLLSIANGISRPQTVERATTTVASSPAPGLAQRASLPLSPRVPRALVSPLPPHPPSLNQLFVTARCSWTPHLRGSPCVVVQVSQIFTFISHPFQSTAIFLCSVNFSCLPLMTIFHSVLLSVAFKCLPVPLRSTLVAPQLRRSFAGSPPCTLQL